MTSTTLPGSLGGMPIIQHLKALSNISASDSYRAKKAVSEIVSVKNFKQAPLGSKLSLAVSTISASVSLYTTGKSIYNSYVEALESGWYSQVFKRDWDFFDLSDVMLHEANLAHSHTDSNTFLSPGNTEFIGDITELGTFTYNGAKIKVTRELEKNDEIKHYIVSSNNKLALSEFCGGVYDRYKKEKCATYKDRFIPLIRAWDSEGKIATKQEYLTSNKQKTLFLQEGVMNTLKRELKSFSSYRENFDLLGIPYRTGILLYGPPGTGKTSTAKVLAAESKRDIYIISLSSLKNDNDLYAAAHNGRGHIIVLEDIDVVKASHTNSDDSNVKSGITRQGLLNVLDGIQSPENVIFVLTTNHRELLDDSLTRSGRIDLELEIGYIDNYQLSQLRETFGIEEELFVPDGVQVTGAEIMGVVRKHVRNPSGAGKDIQDFMNSKGANIDITYMGNTIQAVI